MKSITWHVPATSTSLDLDFDCLGVALDPCNETFFTLTGNLIGMEILGVIVE